MHNYINENHTHPLTFLEIQKAARHFKYYLKQKRTYIGNGKFNGEEFQVVVILDRKDAVLKTCYKLL